jgi:hypothetical protein
MKFNPRVLSLCLAALSVPFAYAEPLCPATRLFGVCPTALLASTYLPESSSRNALPDAPDAVLSAAYFDHVRRPLGADTALRLKTRPFSALAIGMTGGVAGLGFQIATPLATKINLRGGFSFLNYNPNVTEEGIPIAGQIRFRTAYAGVDVYPYRSTFHITPGVTMYNGNRATAVTNIAPGQSFTINDVDYTSDLTDPVHGTFDVSLGRKFAPSITVGFGNMLRRESHWSVPVDFGFQYVGQPNFVLNMQGTVCDVSDGCTPIKDDPDTQANLAQEQATVNREIAPLRFYPIVTFGLSYRFGRIHEMSVWH